MSAFSARPYRLFNKIQHYAWGSKNEQAFIPKLLGLKPQPDLPYAELWMGIHPNAPSEVETDAGRLTLIDFIQSYPDEILGERVARQFGAQLPFLFKVLSAGEPLSIQAHPNKEQAVVLHARDPQHYPDDNHKPEIAIALDHLTALVGFCPEQEIKETLRLYPELVSFIGQPVVQTFMESSSDRHHNAFQKLFTTLMNKGSQHVQDLETALGALEKRLQNKQSLSEKEVLFLELRAKYRTDIGLFVIFFLNLLHLQKGQGVFLKAGLPHAYVRGNIVECMANSDNVVRAGLTPKFKDVKTLTEILTYEMGQPEIYRPSEKERQFVYRVPTDEFSVRKLAFGKEDTWEHPVYSVEICVVVQGNLVLEFGDQSIRAGQGESFLLPAALGAITLRALTPGELFCAFVPVS